VQTETRSHDARPDVVWWRSDQLLGAGFPPALAVQLGHDTRYDLHTLIELVERGCPVELAVRILAPDDPGDCA
jgi:hypothetical protein